MRRSIFPFVLGFLVLLGVGYFVYQIFSTREREFQKLEIPASYLETVDTSRFSIQPLLLTRAFPDDSILVLFPENKSNSQIFIYNEKNYSRLLFGDHQAIPLSQPNADGYAAVYGRPVLNLSGFDAGKYYVHVTSCNFGGFLEIEVADSLVGGK